MKKLNIKNLNIKDFILLIIALLTIINIVIPEQRNQGDFIINADIDKNGHIYTLSYDDDRVYIRKINNDDKIIWEDSQPLNRLSLISESQKLLVTPDGRIIFYTYWYNSSNYKKAHEEIYIYSADGKNKKLILDDKKDIGVEMTISGMKYYDNKLYYFQQDLNNEETVYTLNCIDLNGISDKKDSKPEVVKTIKDTTKNGINNLIYINDNNIIYTTRNSEIYKADNFNNEKKLYPFNEEQNKGISGIASDLDGNVYFEDIASQEIMKISKDTEKIESLYDNNFLKEKGLDYSKLNSIKFNDAGNFLIGVDREKDNNIWIYNEGSITKLEDNKHSCKIVFKNLIASFSLWISILFLFIILLYFIKIAKHKKITIIFKQIFICSIIIIKGISIINDLEEEWIESAVSSEIMEQYYSLSLSEIRNIEAYDMNSIDWSNPYNDEKYNNICKIILNDFTDNKIYRSEYSEYEDGTHNALYNNLYVVRDESIYTAVFENNFINIPISNIYGPEDVKNYEKVVKDKEFVSISLKDQSGQWSALLAPVIDEKGQVVAILEVGSSVSGVLEDTIKIQNLILTLFNIIISIVMLIILIIAIYIFLRPLKKLKNGVAEIVKGNFGIQIKVTSNDEIAEISDAFNKMSYKLKVDMDNLKKLNEAYYRFVPLKMFELLNKKNILDVKMGDQFKGDISLLSLTTNNFNKLSAKMNTNEIFNFINEIFSVTVPIMSSNGGVVERYNNSGLIALYPNSSSEAVKSAIRIREKIITCNNSLIKQVNLGFVINKDDIMIGIVGCEQRFAASVVSEYLTKISKLNSLGEKFGANILVTRNSFENIIKSKDIYNYRMIGKVKLEGKNSEVMLYDFFDGDNYEEAALKKATKNNFESAVHAYLNKDFYKARKLFVEVLKKYQKDKASKEYLKLCDKYYKIQSKEEIPVYIDII